MPTTEISVRGSVTHIRPLPSDSTTTSDPVSAIAKFAPDTPTWADRNACRKWARAAAASATGSSVSPAGRARHLAAEDLPDLGPVPVDGGHQDVAGPVVAELDDELGQVGLQRADAVSRQRLVQPGLLGGHALDLDDRVGAGGADQAGHDRVRLVRAGRPVHVTARPGDVGLQPEQVGVQMGQHVVLDRLCPGTACRSGT